jgi:hypothetical protein
MDGSRAANAAGQSTAAPFSLAGNDDFAAQTGALDPSFAFSLHRARVSASFRHA